VRSSPQTTFLALVDIQEKLLAVIPAAEQIVRASTRLARAAECLGIGRVLVEQYPEGLGRSPDSLAAACPGAVSKRSFSCVGCAGFVESIPPGAETCVLAGLETHICVQQTALDLLERGLVVFIAVDAVGSRHSLDHETALRRLESSGAILTTTESLLFEWCRSADHPRFQEIRRLVLERA
jgi:hypothetical protein